MLFVYKTRFHGSFSSRYITQNVTLPANDNEPNTVLPYTLYVVPKKYPLRVAITEMKVLMINTIELPSNIYIIKDQPITSNAILRVIEDDIPTDFPTAKEYESASTIEPIMCIPNLTEALALYPSLYLRLNHFVVEDLYTYKNICSDISTLHVEDDIILYKNFENRHTLDLYHAKYAFNNTINIYQGYPIKVQNKVMRLDEEWSVIKESDNKLACKYDGHLYFWLISLNYTLVPKNSNRLKLGTTIINANEINDNEIDWLVEKFHLMNFANIAFTEKSIYSEDKENNLFMFSGLITYEECGQYGNIIKRFL